MATKREKQLAIILLKERLERLTGKKVILEENKTFMFAPQERKYPIGTKIRFETYGKMKLEGKIVDIKEDIRPGGFNPDVTPKLYFIKITNILYQKEGWNWKVGSVIVLGRRQMKNIEII